jgi:hypothetical protein
MLELLTDVVVNFGISGFMSNIGATLITKSGKKWQDKLAIGLGSALVGMVVQDAAKKAINTRIEDAKKTIDICTGKENEDGGEISE